MNDLGARALLAAVAFAVPTLTTHRASRAGPAGQVIGHLLALLFLVPPLVLGGAWSTPLPWGTHPLLLTWFLGMGCVTTFLRALCLLATPLPEGAFVRALAFLLLWPDADVRAFAAPSARPRLPTALRRWAMAVLKSAVGLTLVMFGASLGLPTRSAALDVVFMLFEVWAFGSAASDLVVGAMALAGLQLEDAFDWPLRARSVLELWARYDRWFGRGLRIIVFDRIGHRRPAQAVLATFFASGVLHEVLFDSVVPALAGRQLAFFLLHGLGAVGLAALERRLRPPGAVSRALTLLFVLATAPLFFSCLSPLGSLHGDLGPWLWAALSRVRS
jgi:hypothetical protein